MMDVGTIVQTLLTKRSMKIGITQIVINFVKFVPKNLNAQQVFTVLTLESSGSQVE